MSQQSASLEILELLKELRKNVAIGFVGGSDLVKIIEQLSVIGNNSECEIPVPRAYDSIAEFGSQSSKISTSRSQRMA